MDTERTEALDSLNAKILAIVEAETYEAVQDAIYPDHWRVEAIDYANDGACYVTVFSGPDAEGRAIEYSDWKNGQLDESRR